MAAGYRRKAPAFKADCAGSLFLIATARKSSYLPAHMKVIRVPWISCRADEVDAVQCELDWAGRAFAVMAYSEKEARDWWRTLSTAERNELLPSNEPPVEDESGLF